MGASIGVGADADGSSRAGGPGGVAARRGPAVTHPVATVSAVSHPAQPPPRQPALGQPAPPGTRPPHGEVGVGASVGTGRLIARVVVALVLVVCAGAVLAAVSLSVGPVGLVVGAALAVLPAVPVLAALLWLDRYEPEPTSQLLAAFAWGAVVATLVALVVNTTFDLVVASSVQGGDLVGAVVVAPVVEETAKGLGVVALLLWRRGRFDGVVDGIVYAGTVGVGFAMVENVLYLGRALLDSGPGGLAVTFVVRCVVSPFAHPLFTMATGVGIGLAVTSRSTAVKVLAPLGGWVVAVVLHATWNASASLPLAGFVRLYLLVQVPVFAGAVTVAVLARARGGRVIRRNLRAYAGRGWFTDGEVTMLSSLHERARARAWARRTLGPGPARAMRRLQARASDLAFLRERMVRGTAARDAVAVEAATLEEMWRLRALALPARAAPPGQITAPVAPVAPVARSPQVPPPR